MKKERAKARFVIFGLTFTVVEVITIVIAAASLLVSVYAIRQSTIDNRYNVSCLSEAMEVDLEFTKSSKQYAQLTVEPAKGVLKYGLKQKSGTTPTKYKITYRKTTASKWSKVAYASYYQVYRFNEKTASWKKMVETTKTSWEDTGYKTGKNYQFCIRAVRLLKDGTKVYSNWSDEVTFATALEGKPYLSATNVGDTAFKLSWSEVKGATRYIIYRKSINDAWKKVLTLGGDVFTYTSASMLPNTYSYRIKAARYDSIDRVMTSPSNIKTLKSVLAAPVIKQLSEQSDGIKVRWEKIESATSYEVYRSTSLEGSYSRVKKTKHLSCVDSTTKANKTYYYKVRALREHQDDVYYSYFSDVVRN